MIIDFNGTVVDVDVNKTREFYYSDDSVEIDCTCGGCRNYIKYCKVMPLEVSSFFEKIGVASKKVCETYWFCQKNEGKAVFGGGFFHVCGRIIKRCDEKEGIELATDFKVYVEGDKWEEVHLVEDGFPKPIVQIGMVFILPWLLDIENTYQAE